MPEFEENKPNLDLVKDSHQYQPKRKPAQESGQESSTVPSSNMRGRWKRPTRATTPKSLVKDDIQTSRPSVEKESIRQEKRRKVLLT